MTRGTTPTLTLSIDNADLSTLKNMYITFSQETKKLIKVYQAGSENNQIEIDVENSEVAVSLTQDETLKFKPGPVDIQVRYTNNADSAYATNIVRIDMGRILQEGVIE